MDQSVNEISFSKKVIIIGNLSLEGVTDKIVALGHTYKKRNPFSRPDNWIEIQKNIYQLQESGELLAVIMYLTEGLISHSCKREYKDVWERLLAEMKDVPSLIFAPEEFVSGYKFNFLIQAYQEEANEEKKYRKRL